MTMQKVDFLAGVSLFWFMNKRDLRRIAKLTRSHVFHADDVIIREGDRDGRLFIIVRGRVEVIKSLGAKNERRLGTFGSRSYFGEMALIDAAVRTASVVAQEETEVLLLERWNLRQAIEKYPVLAIELLQMLSRRIRVLEETLMKRRVPFCMEGKKNTQGSLTTVAT